MKYKHRRHFQSLIKGIGIPSIPLSLSSLTLILGCGAVVPAIAAERVTLRLGPFEQAIAISDLEQFAKTGELSSNLQLYAPVLTSQVREALNRRLQIDPNVADKLIEDVLRSPTGKQLIRSLEVALPNSSIEQLQAAVSLAARQANGLSLVGFLRAYPEENITLDASSAITLALQFNPSYLQSQALSPLLESELAVKSNTPFKPAFDPAVPGSQTVQQQTLFLQDRQRHRTIPVDLYFPKQAETLRFPISRLREALSRQPLVVISHGFGADRKFFAYLARHLASNGLTVAALEHPGSNAKRSLSVSSVNNPSELLPATEFVTRPLDVSFVLDELAKLNQQPGLLQGKLNTQQVSVIGHSLGGYTALALAGGEVNLAELRQFCKNSTPIGQALGDWLQCAATDLPERKLQQRDQRVKSAIALNPLVGNLFGKSLTQVTIPVLLLAGTEDTITPAINHQLRPFTQLRSPKYLLTAIGGTHLSISDSANVASTNNQSTFGKERQGEETKALRQLVQGVSLAFIKQLTPEAKTYAPFLTSAYAQSFSTSQLPLRLNTQLPASISSWVEVGKP